MLWRNLDLEKFRKLELELEFLVQKSKDKMDFWLRIFLSEEKRVEELDLK